MKQIAGFLFLVMSVCCFLYPSKGKAYQPAAIQQEALVDSVQVAMGWVASAQAVRRQEMDYAAADSLLNLAERFVQHTPNPQLMYMVYTERGFYHRTFGNYDLALDSFGQILTFIDEDDFLRRAIVNNSIATLLRDSGRFLEAPAHHERSLAYLSKIPSGVEQRLAVSYLGYARTFDVLNHLDQSLAMYPKALHYAELAGHQGLRMEVLTSYGNVLTRLGNFDTAMLYYEQGLELALANNQTWAIPVLYSFIGRAHYNMGEPEMARVSYENAILKIGSIRLPWIVRIYALYLDFLLSTRKLAEAAQLIEEIDGFIEELGSHLEKADFAGQKAYYHFLNQNHITAARYFSIAEQMYLEISSYRIEPEFFFRRAFNLFAINNDAGFIMADAALDYLDHFRLELAMSGDARAGFFSIQSRYVSELTLMHMRAGNAAKAFEVAERLKSRVLSEEINFSAILVQTLTDIGQFDAFEDLRAGIISLETRIIEAEDQQTRNAYTLQIEQHRLGIEDLMRQAAGANPEIRTLMDPTLVSLQEAARGLPPGGAGLHVISGEHETGYLFFTANSREIMIAPLGSDALREKVENIRDKIISGLPLGELNLFLDDVTRSIIPLELIERIAQTGQLLISTDGVWSYLPVSALRFGGQYFTEITQISHTPSFTTRALLNDRHSRNRSQSGSARSEVLVFANPKLQPGAADLSERSIIRESRQLRTLPFSELEGRWISEFFPGNVRLLMGEEASLANLMNSNLNNYRLLHFASHALLDERNPGFSGLVLAASPAATGSEVSGGFLRVSEIGNLTLNTDLVVLSACNTGMGRILSGEGVLGLQRAFLHAGSSRVAVTLWSVEDRATALMMRSFYQTLNNQVEARPRFSRRNISFNYAEALRAAQLEMLSNPQYVHPVNWASFVITGL